MKREKCVSIVSPCYNGERYLNNFFENILNQTYDNIELIFVNDGSTDRTEEICNSYREKFEKRNYLLKYIYQENAGQAAAVNRGLELFSGDYFMWHDSDDLLDERNVELKVKYLEEHPEKGFVMCQGRIVSSSNFSEKKKDYYRVTPSGKDNFFEDLLRRKNVILTPGIYMVRSSVICDAFPNRHIIESRIGQNFQMLLPIAASAQAGYLEQDLFSYVEWEGSHSREPKTVEQLLDREDALGELISAILDEIPLENASYYKKIVDEMCIRNKFDLGYRFKDKAITKNYYKKLASSGYITKRDRLIYLAGKYKCVDLLYAYYKRTHKKTTI